MTLMQPWSNRKISITKKFKAKIGRELTNGNGQNMIFVVTACRSDKQTRRNGGSVATHRRTHFGGCIIRANTIGTASAAFYISATHNRLERAGNA